MKLMQALGAAANVHCAKSNGADRRSTQDTHH
jgi:hypothetical protein